MTIDEIEGHKFKGKYITKVGAKEM